MADDFGRIKANVQKMIGLKAPSGDIDGYLAQENWTPDNFKAAVAQTPDQQAVTAAVTSPQFGTTAQPAAAPSVEQSPGLMDEVKRQLGLTARYGIEGLATLPNIVGNAANTVINTGTGAINKAAGTNIPQLPSMSSSVENLISGLPQPQTKIEKIVAEPSRFVASIPSFAVPAIASGIRTLAPLAENLGTQALAATGGGTAFGVSKQVTDNPAIQVAAALLGSAGGAAPSILADRGAQAAQALERIPTNTAIKSASRAGYKAAENAGAIINPTAVQRLQQGVQSDLTDLGYHPTLQPRVATTLSELDRVSKDNITTKGMMVLRRIADNARKSQDPTEKMMGGQIIDKIDDFMGTLKPEDVVQGDAASAADNWQRASALWRQLRKSETVNDAVTKADRQAASTGSGGNTENATRQKIRQILDNPKKVQSFTSDERAAMEQIVRGTSLQNVLRTVGKLSPVGNGLMAALGLGATVANPTMAIAPMAGMAAKSAANRMVTSQVDALSKMIRSGGTQQVLQNTMNPNGPAETNTSGLLAGLLQSLLAEQTAPVRGPGILNFAAAGASGTPDRKSQRQQR